MTLEVGTRLGPYEIVAPLGAGGMGEVYRARDTRLEREVAIKILPEHLADNPTRKARFEREAKTISRLSHPHICTLHDVGSEGDLEYLVLELVEGESLAERLGRGALPIDQVLRYGIEIAEALEAAHKRGIVHRDLKPGNVMLTKSGVKLLDFGLAKYQSAVAPGELEHPSIAPTRTAPSGALTGEGTLVGTFQYMAPEQLEGKDADARSDLFALGCVLYEMATGKPAFSGTSRASVIGAILKEEPEPLATLQPMSPPALDRLVSTCLAKDPDERFQSAHDLALELRWIAESAAAGAVTPSVIGRGSPLARAMPWVGGLLTGALIAALLIWPLAAPTPTTTSTLAFIPPPPGTTFRNFGFSAGPVAVSPDGERLAFSATDEAGVTRLYVRQLDSDKAHAVAGAEDAAWPFWSPDSGSLGFFADQKLKTVNLANLNVRVLADAFCPWAGGAWSSSGIILYTPRCLDPIESIPASGGKPTTATELASGELGHQSRTFLPDGSHFLYWSPTVSWMGPPSIWMGSLGGGQRKLILRGGRSPRFASGHLFFIRENRVFAQPFDPETGELSGEATALAEAQHYSVSVNGVLAYQGGSSQARLQWFDHSGDPRGTVGAVGHYGSVKISPGGSRILANVADPQFDLWSFPATSGPGMRLTYGQGMKIFAVWSPDGKYIAYSCEPDGKRGICRRPADGSGSEEKLATLESSTHVVAVTDWSPDARYLTFVTGSTENSATDVWALPLFGERRPFRLSVGSAGGFFSPDGHWLAYFSYGTGRPEVYVMPFPGPGGKFQISQNGGWLARWDGERHLYFLTMGNRLMQADLEIHGESLRVKAIHPLFQLSLPSFTSPFFDVTPDGSRFLVATTTVPDASRSIGLLLNWEAKLPEGK